MLLNIPVQTVLALGLAMLLNNRLPGSGFVRVVAVLPFLATPVAMSVVWTWFFDPSNGIVNQVLSHVGIVGPAWLSDAATAMPVIAFANIWQYAGYNMLFPGWPAGHPAQHVRGGRHRRRQQDLPVPPDNPAAARPGLLFVLVTGVIGSFQVFDTAYVLTNGGPGNATTVANLNIYNTAFQGFRIGEASAMSVILFLVILVVTVLQFTYFNRRTTYEMV